MTNRQDRREWIQARLPRLPQRGRTKEVIRAYEAERRRLNEAYDRMTLHVMPPRTERQRRVLSEKEMAIIRRG